MIVLKIFGLVLQFAVILLVVIIASFCEWVRQTVVLFCRAVNEALLVNTRDIVKAFKNARHKTRCENRRKQRQAVRRTEHRAKRAEYRAKRRARRRARSRKDLSNV